MKHSSLGPLIALSALAVAPNAFAQEAPAPTTPAGQAAPAPTTPPLAPVAPQDQPSKVEDFGTTPQETKSRRRAEREQKQAEAQDSQAKRELKDPEPTLPATDPSIANAGDLLVTTQVPNFFIEDFDIPPFLLPIYQAAGSEYGVRWEILAAINSIETNFGRNLNVSSAGALGWMQFMPATWAMYGVDANDDGEKDPMNPADAIFAAARYLKAAGADTDLRKAIWAYNHADWYVNDVLERAKKVAALPDSLISSLTGLTQGVFPVDAPDAKVDYAGRTEVDEDERDEVEPGENAADPVESEKNRQSIEISAPAGSRVVAVQDGVIEKVGKSERLGTYVRLRDAYGNRYTYGHLESVQGKVPFPKPVEEDKGGKHRHDEDEAAQQQHESEIVAAAPGAESDAAPATTPAPAPAPTEGPRRVRLAAEVQDEALAQSDPRNASKVRLRARPAIEPANSAPEVKPAKKQRLFANPERPESYANGGQQQIEPEAPKAPVAPTTAVGSLAQYFSIDYGLEPEDVVLKDLKKGQSVIAGTVLGFTKSAPEGTPEGVEVESKFRFEIRPADKAAPRIDPQPILDGWRTLDRTNFYAAQAKKAVKSGDDLAGSASVGQILLMSKAELQKRVLSDKRINIYECGRRDIKAGITDRRVLALLAALAEKDVKPVVTSLTCGRGYYTASGNVSHHTTGTAVDIAAVYDTTITPATQGAGSPTDRAVREILKLQGTMRPDQIITLMKYEGEDNTIAMGDHDDHIHVGYRPTAGNTAAGGKVTEEVLKPGQWGDLVEQLAGMKLPEVSATPSQYSVTVKKPKSK